MAEAIHKHLGDVAKKMKKNVKPLLDSTKGLLKNTAAAAANKVEHWDCGSNCSDGSTNYEL